MYELHYTEQIVDAIIHELPKYKSRKLKSVQVLLGEKYQMDQNAVQIHYKKRVLGTSLEGVVLYLSEENREVLCNACGFSGPLKIRDIMKCSSCHSGNVKQVAGEVLNIRAIELYPE